jgi:hypothetical protein
MILIHIITVAFVCRLVPTCAFGPSAYSECNVQHHHHKRRFPQSRLAMSIPNPVKENNSRKQTTFYAMAHSTDVISTFPTNLHIPFSTDQFFNHTKVNEAMQERYGCTLSYCSVAIGSHLDELASGEMDENVSDVSSDFNSVDDLETYRKRLIDLDFLDELRMEDEPFFPNRIYVRNNMRKIFGLLFKDVGTEEPEFHPTVLIGSPGVGKSVLFFLATLYRCSKKTSNKCVNTNIYFRWSRFDNRVSVFIIFRDEDQKDGERKVHVLFTRSLDETRCKESDGGLADLTLFLERHLHIEREHYFTFIDGPNYTEKHKTMDGCYDYFCTSGGIPVFKNSLWGKARRWMLNGWTKEEALQALIALNVRRENPPTEGAIRLREDTAVDCPNNQDSKTDDMMYSEGEIESQDSKPAVITANAPDKIQVETRMIITRNRKRKVNNDSSDELKVVVEKANQAYWLCGGRIRDLLEAYDDFEGVKMDIMKSLQELDKQKIIPAERKTVVSGGLHLDRMRTMFRNKNRHYDDLMGPLLFVDSPFKLMYIGNRVDVEEWVDAYNLVREDRPHFIQGGFFEMAVHQWLETKGAAMKEPPIIMKVCRSVGTEVEGVEMLKERNMYWVPSICICKFENINSAIVIDNNLHVFQMAVQNQHDFNPITFMENFALPVWENLPLEEKFSSVFIHIVTPSDIDFDGTSFTKKLVDHLDLMESEPHKENDNYYFDIELQPLSQTVDMTSVRTLGRSLKELLEKLSVERTVGRHAKITDRVKRWLLAQEKAKEAKK